jgi:tellurite resistance protein TerC
MTLTRSRVSAEAGARLPIPLTLGVIVVTLAVSIVWSLVATSKDEPAEEEERSVLRESQR